ncbi:hypothetical protein PHMEG_00019878, partial [Phytophthora megakarya]
VHKAMRGFPSGVAAMIVRDLYDMHFARTQEAFVQVRNASLLRWISDPSLVAFARYMNGQWLSGRFSCWQAYVTFNATLKRDYTLRRRLKMGALLRELSSCCGAASETEKPFHIRALAAETLVWRAADMRRGGLLSLSEWHEFEPACAGACQVVSYQ